MAVRKYILALVFAILLFFSYLYIVNKYNCKTVEFTFSGQLTQNDIENLRKSTKSLVNKNMSNKTIPFIINYIGSYGDSKLIMTSGMDALANRLSILEGRWVVNGDIKEVVLGDRASDRFFRNVNVIGQSLRLFGEEYRIVGVVKDSNDIYISYDEDSRVSWSKRSIKFIVEDDKRLYLYIELLEGKLKSLGLNLTDVIIYKQEAFMYLNMILIIAVLILLDILRMQWKRIDKSVRMLYTDYKEQIRIIELHKYIKRNIKAVGYALFKLLVVTILLLAILKCIALLDIPANSLPSNLFSPSSYFEVAKVNLQRYINRLENGISGILLEIHMINLLLILCLGAAVVVNNRPSVRKD